MALGGVGSGFTFSSLAVLMVPHVPQAETGSAMAFNQVLRYLGFTIGSAVSVALMAAYGGGGHGFSATLLTVSSLFVVAAVGAVLLDRAARPTRGCATLTACSSTSSSTPAPISPSTGPASSPRPASPGCSPSRVRTTSSCRWPRLPPPGVETDLMTNVAIAMPRSPMHLANTAYDLQLMSGGRFRLGLGSQIKPHIEKRYGATWSPPAARMREIVLAVKAILGSWQDGTRLHFEGEHTRHTLMPPTFVPGPNPYGVPPVLLGALGPVMTRTAAEVADGLLVMPFHSHRHFRSRTLPAVDEGLARSGRRREDFAILPQAIVAMGADLGRSWRRPRSACAGCSRSTARPRRTSRSSRPRAGRTCSPSSTGCRRPATSARCSTW